MEQQDQALLVAILEAAVDAIIVIDGEGVIHTVNPGACRMFGWSDDELIGQNIRMLMPSPFREQHDGYLRQYRETGEKKIIGIGREVVGKRRDGSTFPMHLAVSQLALGDELLFAGIVRDITDLKQAQLDLARANERLEQRVQERTSELESTQAELLKTERLATLGQVSGGIAHEIRNPLNAVRTSVYFLRHARQLSSEKVAEHLERIDRQVSLIDNVVTALSDIARLPEPKLAPCDVNGIVREALASISLPESIDVQVALPDEPLLAAIDPNQISIVLRNLIRNARDAMAEGGTITLSAREDGEQVIVKVTDTGTGIPEEELKRITEPLYSTKARGMGLGLAISVAILQKNQGRLEVSSQVGQGTEFSIRLHRSCEGYD